jgi:hypothetical protein
MRPYAVCRMKNPPGIHSYTSLARISTAGTPSVATVSPAVIHFPMKISSGSCSGVAAVADIWRSLLTR